MSKKNLLVSILASSTANNTNTVNTANEETAMMTATTTVNKDTNMNTNSSETNMINATNSSVTIAGGHIVNIVASDDADNLFGGLVLKTGYRLYADEGGQFISESAAGVFPPVLFRDAGVLAYTFNNRTNTGDYRLFKTVQEAHKAMGAWSVWREKVYILGQGLVSLSQEVFFTDTTRAHGEFKELIQKVLERAQEIIAAPVTSMRGVDPRVVERRKFHVNDYMNVEARPKKAMEWLSEIEDLCQKMLQALNWTYVQSWQYIDQEERAQLVWRQLDIHMMALSVYFRDYADYSMNELTLGNVAQIGLVPTSWDLREDKFEFGFETEHGYWQAYDKAECIKLWLAGTLHPEVLVRCSNSYASAQLSPHRALPWAYRPYFR